MDFAPLKRTTLKASGLMLPDRAEARIVELFDKFIEKTERMMKDNGNNILERVKKN